MPAGAPRPAPTAPERRGITVRRAPKYVPFLILGALWASPSPPSSHSGFPGDESYDPGAVFGFFLVLCGAGGAILGAIAALVLDRLSVRRAEHAVVESVPESARTRRASRRLGRPAGHKPAAGKVLAHHREIINQWHAAMENFLMIFSLAKKALRTLVASSGSGHPVKK